MRPAAGRYQQAQTAKRLRAAWVEHETTINTAMLSATKPLPEERE